MNNSQTSENVSDCAETFVNFDWGDGLGKHHSVPKDWVFPSNITCKAMWDLWHYGDVSTGICPYGKFFHKIELKRKNDLQNYSRAKCVVAHIYSIISNDNLLLTEDEDVFRLQMHDSDAVFNNAYSSMVSELYGTSVSERVVEVSYGRIYNLITEKSPYTKTGKEKKRKIQAVTEE